MTRRRIDLRIGELVLEGVAPSDRARLIATLERELAAGLADGRHPTRSRDAIVGERPVTANPSELGRGIARTIVGGGKR
jgi:hypothetical protein